MELHTCIFTENDCYKVGRTIIPQGIMVHSTGANNPNLKRYVQPDDGELGKNKNANDWNRSGVGKCAHAFIGKKADGRVATYQTLPWHYRAWHCGASGNSTHISFEVCEDGLTDAGYFDMAYKEAVELTAHLCTLYDLDPLADGVVIDHNEGHLRGIASAHTDWTHWLTRFNKTMDDFRKDVYLHMQTGNKPSEWAKEATEWAISEGIFSGDGNGDYRWQEGITREEVASLIYRLRDRIL